MKTKFEPKPFQFYIDPKLAHKLDLLIAQLKIRDTWIIVDGDEGSGKTNLASYLLYYVHCKTGREFTLDRFYFDSDDMFNWVKDNNNGLVNWDEASLGGLSMEWWNKSQRNLIKFAMTGRKKHHFFVLCIPKFNKLQEYLRVDRSHALIHMHTGRRNNQWGHYMYLTRRGKYELNQLWSKRKIRAYGKCMKKYGGFGAYCPYVFSKILDEEAYEKKKDFAISNIGKKKLDDKDKLELHKIKNKIGKLTLEDIRTKTNLAKFFGITQTSLNRWRDGVGLNLTETRNINL